MIEIKFITPSGETHVVEGNEGQTLMELAIENNIEGVEGDCGGACSCATCHVHVSPESKDKVGPAGDNEQNLLDFSEHASEYSRLSCQVPVTLDLNGTEFTVVEEH